MSLLPPFLRDAASGFVGAFGLTYVGMPFDTIKVRLQTTDATVFKSPLDCVARTMREEGVAALWKGSVPALTSALTENLVVFAANGIIRRAVIALTNNNNNNNNNNNTCSTNKDKDEELYLGVWKEMMIGGASGFCSATAICPAEVLKCRLQADRSISRGSAATKKTSLYQSGWNLYKLEGSGGFFRGLPALWMRDVPFYVVFFTSYTTYIDTAVAYHGCEKSELSKLHFIMGGGIAGACGWACVFPFDVIKSRMQIGTIDASLSLFQACTTLLRKEGASQLLRGWAPCVLRGFPANGALFFGVETTQRMLEKY